MRIFMKDWRRKLLFSAATLPALLLIAVLVYRLSGSVNVASWLFFPLPLYQFLSRLLRQPGYDDLMVGSPRFPGSDLAALAATAVLSLLLAYLVISPLMEWLQQRKNRDY